MPPKPFAVVKFPMEDDSLAVVPVGWLSHDWQHCHWPKRRAAEVIRLAREEADPSAPGCEWFRCPVAVVTTCRSYKNAEKKAKKYEMSSAVESSAISGNEGPDGPDVRLPSPPPRLPSPPPRLPSPPPQLPSPPRLISPPSLLSSHSMEAATPAGANCTAGCPAGSASTAGDLEDVEEATSDPTMLKVLRLLLEIRQQQREILQRVSRLEQARQEPRTRSPSPPVSSLPPLCPQLPAFSIEDFEAAEAAVRDDRVAAALKKQLLRLGGNNLKEVAANVMGAVMGVAVQRLFSLRGRKGKRPFVGTKLCRVATDAICERQGVDILAAQGFIGRWLPGACDRGGGRKRRYAQALEPPESHAQAPPANPCAGSAPCPGAPSASCPATPPGMAILSHSGVHPSSAPPQPPPHAQPPSTQALPLPLPPPQPPRHAQPPHVAPLPHGLLPHGHMRNKKTFF
ncbi:uncharacterized protein LOC144102078 [Amblyomma americanum]